jgi:hypothetical protein
MNREGVRIKVGSYAESTFEAEEYQYAKGN